MPLAGTSGPLLCKKPSAAGGRVGFGVWREVDLARRSHDWGERGGLSLPGGPQPLSGSPVASAGDLPAALFRTLRSRGSQREKRPMTPPDRPGVPTVPHPGRGRRYATDLLLLFITMGTVRLPGPSLGADGVTDGVVTLPALEVLSYALGMVRSASRAPRIEGRLATRRGAACRGRAKPCLSWLRASLSSGSKNSLRRKKTITGSASARPARNGGGQRTKEGHRGRWAAVWHASASPPAHWATRPEGEPVLEPSNRAQPWQWLARGPD